MPFTIERNDLATMNVDAVVVAANEQLKITGGVGASVAKAAGFEQLQAACDEIGGCPLGQAVVTPGFAIPARFVVHAVSPVWDAADPSCKRLLRSTYDNALACAYDAGAASIALPLISAGAHGCPNEISFAIAMQAVRAFLDSHDDVDVRVVLFSREQVAAGLALYGEIAEYIDDHYVDEQQIGRNYAARERESYQYAAAPPRTDERHRQRLGMLSRVGEALAERAARLREAAEEEPADAYAVKQEEECAVAEEAEPATAASAPADAFVFGLAPAATGQTDLKSLLDNLDAPFSTTLLALIDARGLDDVQVYKRANMSRQLFSKIRSDANYRPTKRTVLALAIALELSLDETADLLRRAGFALSASNKADVIVQYFIGRGGCDIYDVNEALYAFDQPLL